jgi:hypothetical protein
VRDGGIQHDGELPGGDTIGVTVTHGSAPPDCAHATFQNLGDPQDSNVAVFDAP